MVTPPREILKLDAYECVPAAYAISLWLYCAQDGALIQTVPGTAGSGQKATTGWVSENRKFHTERANLVPAPRISAARPALGKVRAPERTDGANFTDCTARSSPRISLPGPHGLLALTPWLH